MSTSAHNPYQPPPPTSGSIEVGDDTVGFFTTDANLRFAESHFVLRLHPLRLIIVSLALIVASSVVMVLSILFGIAVFAVSSVAAMIISAVIYLSSVRRTKVKLRSNWSKYGLMDGTVSSVAIDQQTFVLKSPNGEFRWPLDAVKTYRTRKGLMLSPEPLLCVFVPKRNESLANYDELRSQLLG